MEVQPFEKIADNVGPTTIVVDTIEDVAGCVRRQRWDSRAPGVKGTIEMWDVMHRQRLVNRHSSTAEYISRVSVPRRSRNGITPLEDRKRRRGVRSSVFSTPAPITLEAG